MLSPSTAVTYANAGVPVDGAAGTLAGIAPKGAQLVDTTNANLYVNTNTQASPTWSLVSRYPTVAETYRFAGVPVDGGAGTLFGVASKGALVIDTTNADIYINAGTLAVPVWKLITRAA